MPIITQTDFTRKWKIFMRTTALVIGSTAAWSGMQELKAEDFGHLYIISIPAVLACIAGLIYSIRHKIVLTDQALWQYGFFTKCIPLTDIERISENKISENRGAYLIKSAKNRSISHQTYAIRSNSKTIYSRVCKSWIGRKTACQGESSVQNLSRSCSSRFS